MSHSFDSGGLFEELSASFQRSQGTVCCVLCQIELSHSAVLTEHHRRKHTELVVRMHPGELDAVIELIRAQLVADRVASGESVFSGPHTESERLLWNFFVRHDKRLKKLWSFLNSPELELETDEEP